MKRQVAPATVFPVRLEGRDTLKERATALNLRAIRYNNGHVRLRPLAGGRPTDFLTAELAEAHLEQLERPGASPDLQTRVQPFGLILLNLGDRVRIGSPGRYIDFANREAAEAAVSLLELVSPEKRARPTVAQLEAILADESPHKVVVNPDGTISAIPFKEPSPELFKLLEETRKRHDL